VATLNPVDWTGTRPPTTDYRPPAASNRIDRVAKGSLLAALAVALVGVVLVRTGVAPFWGGLLKAFGEAALVGGLADWFAVRALFTHPFGIPFPHTALIPRNRQRIVREIRDLVLKEWLPPSLLTARIEAFDFVGDALLPAFASLRPQLTDVLRGAARDVLGEVPPRPVAGFLARTASTSIEPDKIGPFLADLTQRAREQGWLEPLLREWVERLHRWAESPHSWDIIHRHLEGAAEAYRDKGFFKKFTYRVAEVFGGIDLDEATTVLQDQIKQFAAEQLAEEGQVREIVHDGLAGIEKRLREDPQFLQDVRTFVLETADAGSLGLLFEPVLTSLKSAGLRELERPDSPVLAWALDHLGGWLDRLAADTELRDAVNAWCRRLAVGLVERHHPLLGTLVEEQLNRLSERNLTELIEARVGEDLNWIRLNGTFVGGLVGVLIYLVITGLTVWLPSA
jgi:uncharacterized membrane-anchored protein YjiN (DUF445 family)